MVNHDQISGAHCLIITSTELHPVAAHVADGTWPGPSKVEMETSGIMLRNQWNHVQQQNFMYVYIYICMYIYVCMYVYIYIAYTINIHNNVADFIVASSQRHNMDTPRLSKLAIL